MVGHSQAKRGIVAGLDNFLKELQRLYITMSLADTLKTETYWTDTVSKGFLQITTDSTVLRKYLYDVNHLLESS
jgi:hypothetical protein